MVKKTSKSTGSTKPKVWFEDSVGQLEVGQPEAVAAASSSVVADLEGRAEGTETTPNTPKVDGVKKEASLSDQRRQKIFNRRKQENIAAAAVHHANEGMKSVALAAFLVFFSNVGEIGKIFLQFGRFIVLPALGVTEFIATLLALRDLVKADNRNLGKTFTFAWSAISTVIILSAIIGSFLGLPVLVGTALFIGVVGINALYNLGQYFYHVYRGQKATTPAENDFFLDKAVKYGLSSLVGCLVAAALVLSVFMPLVAPALMVVAIAAAALVLIVTAYGIYKHFHPVDSQMVEDYTVPMDDAKSVCSDTAQLVDQVVVGTRKTPDYYAHLTYSVPENTEQYREELTKKLCEKVIFLSTQMKNSVSYIDTSQKDKREAKLQHLSERLVTLLPKDENQANALLQKYLLSLEEEDHLTEQDRFIHANLTTWTRNAINDPIIKELMQVHKRMNNMNNMNDQNRNATDSSVDAHAHEYWTESEYSHFKQQTERTAPGAFQAFWKNMGETESLSKQVDYFHEHAKKSKRHRGNRSESGSGCSSECSSRFKIVYVRG